MRPSPAKRSSVPSKSRISSPSAAWYSCSTAITSSGSAVSAKAVKPRRSQKTTVTSRRWLSSSGSVARGDDQLGDLRRQKALEPAHPLDLGDLLGDALLERAVPVGEFGGLLLHLVVQRLDAQHRIHPRDQRRLIDRLGQVFVGAGLEPGDDVLVSALAVTRMIGMNGSAASRFSRRQTSKPSSFGIMTSSRIRSGPMLARPRKRLLAVGRRA